jgi:hypothetical protein
MALELYEMGQIVKKLITKINELGDSLWPAYAWK